MGSARFIPSKADLIGAKFQVSLSNEVLIDVAILLGKKELSFIRALTLPQRHGFLYTSGSRPVIIKNFLNNFPKILGSIRVMFDL